MNLRQKLIMGFMSVVVLLIIAGAMQVNVINEIEHEIVSIGESNVGEARGSGNIAYRIALMGANLNEYLLETTIGGSDHSAELKRLILADWEAVKKALDELMESTQVGIDIAAEEEEEEDEEGEMEMVAQINELLDDYRELIDQTFAIASSRQALEFIPAFLERHQELESEIRQESRELFEDAIEEIDEAVEEVGEEAALASRFIAALALLGVALAGTVGLLISRPLIRRIGKLHRTTVQVQSGDLDAQVPDITAKDEVAELSHAFNAMVRDLKHSTASIDDLNRQVKKRLAAEAELQQAHDHLEERVHRRTRDLNHARLDAETANRSKSEFLANMSHELRTPLNHIIGFTELIAGEKLGSLNEMQQEYLTDVITSSRHLLALINDILDLSKVEAGKMELMLSNVNTGAMLKNATVMFKEKAMQHQINLVVEDEQAPESVLADEIKLKQILYNLLSNAIKYTPDQGRIQVKVWALDSQDLSPPEGVILPDSSEGQHLWAVRVTDSGQGIPDEDLTRIFNPFEQVKSKATAQIEGTGLGLALTQRMVELHGGVIWAENGTNEEGAIFTIVLPEEAETPEAEE